MKSPIRNLPDCDDTRELSAALKKLSDRIPSAKDWIASSTPYIIEEYFNLGTGGTSLRFFTALAASIPGLNSVVDCSEALKRRPLAGLTDALTKAGANIAFVSADGYPPMKVCGKYLPGGKVAMDGKVSSQFISALLMASELWKHPLELELKSGMVSRPYVEMTEKMLLNHNQEFNIEPDWSAASYFYELALVAAGVPVRMARLCEPSSSVQGDSACAAIFDKLGVKTDIFSDGSALLYGDPGVVSRLAVSEELVEFDLGDVPDLTPALAVGMCNAGIRFRFSNVAHLRHKECDRMAVLHDELSKLGYKLICGESTLEWNGETCRKLENAVIDCHADHRIAMAFSIAAVKTGEIKINDSECVSKSFPGYFDELLKVGFQF